VKYVRTANLRSYKCEILCDIFRKVAEVVDELLKILFVMGGGWGLVVPISMFTSSLN